MSGTAQLMEIPPQMPDLVLNGVSDPAVYRLNPPLRGDDFAIGFVGSNSMGDGFVLWRCDRRGAPAIDPERIGVNQLMIDRVWDVTDHAVAFAALGYTLIR